MEYIAYADNGNGRQNVMVQVPNSFDVAKSCVVTAKSRRGGGFRAECTAKIDRRMCCNLHTIASRCRQLHLPMQQYADNSRLIVAGFEAAAVISDTGSSSQVIC